MNVSFYFYGILLGSGGRTGSLRDYRHCWPNIKRMLVDPFTEQGYNTDVNFSSYKFSSKLQEDEFFNITKPKTTRFVDLAGSDPFTSKYNAFELIEESTSDVIVLTRSDVHWSKKIAQDNIDIRKFNFLFPEKEWWATRYTFTCDNFYLWPSHMNNKVKMAMKETYGFPRGKPYVDTHALLFNLRKYISLSDINFVSNVEELSDVNSYYTCCRSGLPKRDTMHSEVSDRYEIENWEYFI